MENLLRTLMISATIFNMLVAVWHIIKIKKCGTGKDGLAEATVKWLKKDPKHNFIEYLKKKRPEGVLSLGEACEEFDEWCEEVNADLPTKALNIYCIYEFSKPTKTNQTKKE